MQVQPYLFFAGRCEEALEFYSRALGAEITMLMRYKDNPEPQTPDMLPPGFADKVMHASFRIAGTEVLASDGSGRETLEFKGFSLCLTPDDDAAARKLFQELAEGGKVVQPLTRTFFSSSFGMLTDRFGIMWMLFVPPESPSH